MQRHPPVSDRHLSFAVNALSLRVRCFESMVANTVQLDLFLITILSSQNLIMTNILLFSPPTPNNNNFFRPQMSVASSNSPFK